MTHNRTYRHFESKLMQVCYIAGTNYHIRGNIDGKLRIGDKLLLVREPDNAHDHKAVAVTLPKYNPYYHQLSRGKLGYIPRTDNTAIAAMFDMGWGDMLEAKISRITPSQEISIEVYIKSKTPSEPRYNSVRLSIYTNEEADRWNEICTDIWNYGVAWEQRADDTPEVGDKAVLIRQQKETSQIYLTQYIDNYATEQYNRPLAPVDYFNNCKRHFFSIVKGPITRSTSELQFLGKYLNAEQSVLNHQLSHQLMQLFEPSSTKKMYILRLNSNQHDNDPNTYYYNCDINTYGFRCQWHIGQWEEAKEGDTFVMIRTEGEACGVVSHGQFLSASYTLEAKEYHVLPAPAGNEERLQEYDIEHYVDIAVRPPFANDVPYITLQQLEEALPEVMWRGNEPELLLTDEQAQKIQEMLRTALGLQ